MKKIFLFSNWPLLAKLLTGMLVMSLLPLVLATTQSTELSINTLRGNELKNIKQVAENVAGRIGQLLADTQKLSAYLGGNNIFANLIEKRNPANLVEATAVMQRLVGTNPDIDLVILMDVNGDALTSNEPSVIGKNFKFREYFKAAIQGRQFSTGIIVGSTLGGSGVYISSPVKNKQGLIIGIVVLRLTYASISSIVEDARSTHSRYGFIVDSDGIVIYHPSPEWLHRSLMPLTIDVQKRISKDRRFAKESIESLNQPELNQSATGAKRAGSLSFVVAKGQLYVAGFAPVNVQPWTVVISSPEDEFIAPVKEFYLRTLSTAAFLSIVFSFLIFIFARWLNKPVKQLTASARAIADGRFIDSRLEISRKDELGMLAKTFNDMSNSLQIREREREIFGKLVSPDVRDKLISGDIKLGGEQLLATVLFSDIRGFTAISEALGPHEVVLMLNEYLTEMTEAIKPWNGYINNFIGDAIVVVFGAPSNQDNMQIRAINAAFEMRKRLSNLNQRRIARGDAPIDNGIGIASGKVIAGQMGSLERCIYTVIGDTVNIAARIESMTREFVNYPVLVNHETYDAIKDGSNIKGIYLGEQNVKGRKGAVKVYAVEE